MGMMHSSRAARRCTWGCCGDNPPSRTLRTREKAQARKQAEQEQADRASA